MPGPLFHAGAVATCPHGAPVQTVVPAPRVLVNGVPAATALDVYTVVGCPFQIPVGAGTKPQPCVKVVWPVPSARVLIGGPPAVTALSGGLCQSVEQIPAGPPVVTTVQPRAVAS